MPLNIWTHYQSNSISREKGERINQTQYSNFAKSVKILHGIKSELPKKFLCFNENHSSVTQLTRNKDKKSATTFSVLHGLNFCPDIMGKPRNVTLYANLLITALKTKWAFMNLCPI